MSVFARMAQRLESRRRLSEEDDRRRPGGGARAATTTTTTSSAYAGKRSASHAAPRELVNDRYLLDKVLGRGSFGKVVLAYDLREDKHVAIKVVERSARNDVAVAQEIALLRQINGESTSSSTTTNAAMSCDNDMGDDFSFLLPASGKEKCVRLLDAFEHDVDRSSLDGREHLAYQCLVFDLMSHSLYDLLRVTNLGGVSIKLVRKFGVQILHALAYLKSQNIIHCDMKPENVLLCHPERSAVKIIDFGSACKVGKQQFSYVQSRFYRAPEVMLGMKYGCAIDMWSLGCMLYEMRTGKPLFTGRSEHDQLFKIENTIGRISHKTFMKIPMECQTRYFESDGRMKPSQEALRASQSSGRPLPEPSSRSVGRVLLEELVRAGSIFSPQSANSLDEMMDSDGALSERRRERKTGVNDGEPDDEHHVFLSLLNRMLTYDPDERITPEQALAHPFFYSIEHNARPLEAVVRRSIDRLPSIPNMDTVTELNAREAAQGAVGGIGERFTFIGQPRKPSGNSFAC
jgi:dual specificity tyrosine-phosphorylation-regulated kinase 1